MKLIKLTLLASGFLLLGVFSNNSLNAQASANATLNVVLSDVRSIKVNPAQTSVSLTFSNVNDYNNGVTSEQNAHLEITSTGGYIIKVRSSTANLVNGPNSIPANTVQLTPKQNSTGVAAAGVNNAVSKPASLTPVNLSASPSTIISSTDGATKIFYDMTYKASGGPQYINKANGTYTTTITYTIEPQ